MADLKAIKCPACGIAQAAVRMCPACGADMATGIKPSPSPGPPSNANLALPPWRPGIAALLSIFIPGTGHIYKGEVGAGLLWFIGTFVGYTAFIIPGLIVHLICIFNAASGHAKP